jgi:hypothetical protein
LATLDVLSQSDPELMGRLLDISIPNREIARQIGKNESVVRRWRAKRLQSPQSISTPQPKYKNGVAQWVPGMDLGQDDGEVRTIPRYVGDEVDEPGDAELMTELGVDPEKWEIIARRESRWQQIEGGKFLRAYRISVRRRSSRTGDLSVESMNEILAASYGHTWRRDPAVSDNRVYVVPVGDLQVGKIDGGGTAALIDRFAVMTEQVRMRLLEAGGAHRVVLPWLGDCIEGVVSQGGRLATRLDISVTEQVRVYRRLMLHQVAAFAPLADHLIVPVLPGNHDENYRMVDQPVTDSWAIEGASAVQDALVMSGRYENVSFLYPEDEELVVTLNVGTDEQPYVLGFTHGHLARQPNAAIGWWEKQSFGRQHGGSADIMFTGHFHHLRVEGTGGGRTWIQIPQLDGGSNWFRRSSGANEPAGMVSLWVTPSQGVGWKDLAVHR